MKKLLKTFIRCVVRVLFRVEVQGMARTYPRTLVVNHRDQVLKASGELRFPLIVKPNVGGSGALIERFDSRADLEARSAALDLGPDGTALVQEFVESEGGADRKSVV